MAPRYEYRCVQCSLRRTVDERGLVKCPCGKDMRRVYSAPAVHFKGDGWAGKE